MMYMNFKIRFNYLWLRIHKGKNGNDPVERIREFLNSHFETVKFLTTDNGCDGTIALGDKTSDDAMHMIYVVLMNEYDITPPKYSIETSTYDGDKENPPAAQPVPPSQFEQPIQINPEAKEAYDKAPEQPAAAPEKPKEQAPEAAYDKIMDLVGAEEFKALAKELKDSAQGFIKNGLLPTFRTRCYLFSVGDGWGYSTYLAYLGVLMDELELYKSSSAEYKATEVKLGPPNNDKCFELTLSQFDDKKEKLVIGIDISEWLQKLSSVEFRGFLSSLERKKGEHIIVFRVPYIEKKLLSDVMYVLEDIFFVKAVSVPPFSPEEIDECGRKILGCSRYILDEQGMEVFRSMVAAEKSDGRFYGVKTIKKITRKIVFENVLRSSAAGKEDNILGADIWALADEAAGSELNVNEALDKLIGMEDVKKRLNEIVAQIAAVKENPSLGKPSMHMRFVGSPGTGKTTIARILGQILKDKKILRNGGFVEVQGRDLCGRYVGETAPKTAGICRDSYGSVLFIDEAYTLYKEDTPRDFGREAIETLLAEMENHRDDMVVIMAGYSDEMDKLMEANPGFESRMPYVIEFPNYSREDLCKIFMMFAKKSFKYDEAFEQSVSEYFDGLGDDVLGAKTFSNVRFVRNLFERTWGKAATRCQLAGAPCDTLTATDFGLASSDREFALKPQEKKRRLGF